MRNRPFAFVASLLAGSLAACGGAAAPAGGPAPIAANEWRFGTDEHVALWYHGLALAEAGVEANAPVPIYRAGYAAEAAAARRRISGASTPFSSSPTTLGSRLRSSGAGPAMQFLPLYFDSWQQMRQAVDVWQQAGGDPNRASDAQTQAVIAFLSSRFGTSAQRAAVVEFVNALEAERAAFFAAWWRESQPATLAAESQALWQSVQPNLISFLRWANATRGRVSLSPALRAEGRVEMGRGIGVAAVGGSAGENPRAVVGRLVHELSYPIATDAVRDAVAPARIREIGEDVLVSRAAIRAGALVLERLAPDLLPAYREDYLRAAGADPARTSLAQQFPVPAELLDALEAGVRLATSGI